METSDCPLLDCHVVEPGPEGIGPPAESGTSAT